MSSKDTAQLLRQVQGQTGYAIGDAVLVLSSVNLHLYDEPIVRE